MDIQEWLDKSSTKKGYAHFDRKVELKDVFDEIRNPQTIINHSFMPFIHYPLTFHKYSKKNGNDERKDKIRKLYYSSHYDRCIYQYYSYLLNEQYNQKAIEYGIENVAIAYRTNLKKNNIHFAKEAFDFIKAQTNCFIIVGDFKDFFDQLEHKYLKEKLCRLLNVSILPEDYYKVFRSITKYSYVNLTELLKYYDLKDTKSNRKLFNEKEIALPIQELRENKKWIYPNYHDYGIPQGSAISAVLSNIYMLDFDQRINTYIKKYNGKYLRYSDDTIFIFPIIDDNILDIYKEIIEIVHSAPRLNLQKEKTKLYSYCQGRLNNRDSLFENRENDKDIIDYLGFSFDGKNISIRDKTVSKYYYRTYKKADTIAKCGGINKNGKKISCKNLYRIYTLKGVQIKKEPTYKGNFLSYVKRCKKIFNENESKKNKSIENKSIDRIINTHYGKIKKRLKR